MSKLVGTAACLASLLLAATSTAEPTSDEETRARALFEKAEVQFNLGKFARALELYERAYQIKPLHGFLFNIGQCHRNLGRHKKALFFFRIYLERLPDPPNREQVEKLIEKTERELKEKEAKARGRQQRASEIPAKKENSPPPAAGRQDRSRRSIWLWSGVGVSGALLATGAVTGILAQVKSDKFNDPATPPHELKDLEDSGKALRLTATITLVAGGVTAVATALIYLLYPGGGPEKPTVSFEPRAGGGALFVGGRF